MSRRIKCSIKYYVARCDDQWVTVGGPSNNTAQLSNLGDLDRSYPIYICDPISPSNFRIPESLERETLTFLKEKVLGP